eukprot:TRINITY_DN45730_c0_g1_i1.p1 TRINITY_DN45730_c0_g1~~TRINITY_DN45730_c0_g1_i1.p1  ORF type:complete len:190 (+),score=37.34 TRINITY_DN45730_c0_g1_i1:73-570(+)
MLASRVLRASKFVVGVGVKDIEGTKQSIKKAINMARAGDRILAVNIPSLVPEMLLSSMSDPSDMDEGDRFMMLAKLPSVAGASVQQIVKDTANEEMKRLKIEIEVDYRVGQPSSDIKSSILSVCKNERADYVVLGPGVNGNGSIPPFVTARANGVTVCVVRDHIK